jgi:hypothetical protein
LAALDGLILMRNRHLLKAWMIVATGVTAGLLLRWYTWPEPETPFVAAPAVFTPAEPEAEQPLSTPESRRDERKALADAKLMRKLREALERKDARPNELILGF